MRNIAILVFSLFFIAFLPLNTSAQKQKIKYDKKSGLVTVDGISYAFIEKENAPGQLGVNKNYTILNLENEALIYLAFQQEDVYDNYGRKTQEVKSFYNVNFLSSGKKSKVIGIFTASSVAKMVVKNQLIKDDIIDSEAEEKFHMKY